MGLFDFLSKGKDDRSKSARDVARLERLVSNKLSQNYDRQEAIAELSNQMQPEVQKVTDISKSGSDVVLKFAGNFQGNPFDAAITLTPDGTDKCKVTFDVNGGQFTMSGTGAKK